MGMHCCVKLQDCRNDFYDLTCVNTSHTQRACCRIQKRNVAFAIPEATRHEGAHDAEVRHPPPDHHRPEHPRRTCPAHDTTVEIQPANPAKSRDVKAAEHTTADYADGVLKIQAPAKNQYAGPSGSIDVTIKLPAGSHTQATAASTELRTTGRLGDVTFEGAYRHIKLDETANLHLTTTHGDITAHSL
jgi:hypothetical protein